ncbi:MAG: small multi-drug export protein [Firmicutes bacterium]|nr:small multi-drug export protein [Bacillota bacterium]
MRPLLWWAIGGAAVFLAAAVVVGWLDGRMAETVPLIGSAIVLEAQPAAALSIPLGFGPVAGALVSILANLVPLPIMIVALPDIINRWGWARRQVERATRVTRRYQRFGVLSFVVLAPFLGAYACVAVGITLGWRMLRVLPAVMAGMVASVGLIVFGGNWAVHLFLH